MAVSAHRGTQPINDLNAQVLLFEHRTASGAVVAEARLNSERTLNALSLDMIHILKPALERWRDDPDVAVVLLTGTGERAFSAGGDIQALYRAISRNLQANRVVDDYPFRFFEHEYRLDFQLHTFTKPVISLGHGIVMGGGLGVFSGARYRVVTEKSRIAMPEITIGLFPDAGATWLLGQMPAHWGTFLAATGSHMNAADALLLGLGTHAVAVEHRAAVLAALQGVDWRGDAEADHGLTEAALGALPGPELPAAQLLEVPDHISPHGSVQEVAEQLKGLRGRSAWIDRGLDALAGGCPTSVGIVVEQLKRAPGMALADTFRLEMVVATQCAHHPDFREGVRALIIDKDNRPQWRYADLAALPASYVAEHFEPPWPRNPLADLV